MNVDAPPERNYGQETRDTLQAQVDLAPDRFRAESEFSPQYVDLGISNLRRGLLGADGGPGMLETLEEIAPRLQSLQSASELSQRERDIASVESLGARAVSALRSADPNQAALIDRLNREAMADLDAGTSLTPAEAAEIEQRVRGSQAARGFGFSLPDSVLEAYTLGDRGRALRNERRDFASRVAGVNAATGQDPFMAVLGRPSSATASASGVMGQGQQQTSMSGPTLFSPESAYAADVFNTNTNAKAAANIASTNANTSIIAGGLSAL